MTIITARLKVKVELWFEAHMGKSARPYLKNNQSKKGWGLWFK
jgi:hypothetical protein